MSQHLGQQSEDTNKSQEHFHRNTKMHFFIVSALVLFVCLPVPESIGSDDRTQSNPI